MDPFMSKVWKLIDLQLPLVVTDAETYLVREGNLTQEDYEKLKNSTKSIKISYYSGDLNKLKTSLKEALNQLKTIQPKKPFPPEMKARFDAVIKTLSELAETAQATS
ncbi:hypothetical protein [Metallosphaera sedula]|uniref:Uncharacterized protein n=4 Tax=Metallosphaera TaxID=41980 RepID=A4YDC4_METS5|nr:hypothetical protein [Metallosphaera sedula]MCY0862067.1 hypothetical protein [Metallosphaera prunae]ABP94426.1 hypothetical protein Msed_0249 [Metallosphaera sedula DSM 5348]AIM26413.1 hypothetical protein HA72_0249 [Metallosphaera sedula]AKV73415.1 hypothetical protein MsedA_0260 [Metallosphaera sedula]AKV75658.1 hypothetical protein MsedB_0260 [Metallosphaera sedula]